MSIANSAVRHGSRVVLCGLTLIGATLLGAGLHQSFRSQEIVDRGGLIAVPAQLTWVTGGRSDGHPVGSEVEVVIRNTDRTAIQILDTVSPCNCTLVSRPEKKLLQPGEDTTMRISATPPSSGEQRTAVRIITDSATHPETTISLRLVGPPLDLPSVIAQPGTVAGD